MPAFLFSVELATVNLAKLKLLKTTDTKVNHSKLY